jgi:hypothetical protein
VPLLSSPTQVHCNVGFRIAFVETQPHGSDQKPRIKKVGQMPVRMETPALVKKKDRC